MANFTYALGPWVRRQLGDGYYWDAPDGADGRICLGSLPDCATSPSGVDHRPVGLFCFAPLTPLGLDYLSLGTGDCRELQPSAAIRNSAATLLGVTPEGDTLADWLGYWLFEAGSTDGQDRWKLGTPTRDGEYEIHLAGHSRVWSDRFAGPADTRWNRLRDLLRADLDGHDKECKAEAKTLKDIAKELRKQGKTKDAAKLEARAVAVENHAEKVLDWMCRKHQCLPSELSTTIQRGRASTTITDDFTRVDGETIGNQLSWTEYGTWDTVSNRASLSSNTAPAAARAGTALSAADHYSQCKVYGLATSYWQVQSGACARFSSSAQTHYVEKALLYSGYYATLQKVVAGTETVLNTAADTPADGDTIKVDCTGTTITGHRNGSQKTTSTDSSISGNLYAGIFGYRASGAPNAPACDDFEASDGIVGGNPKSPFGGIMLDGPFRRVVFP